MDQARRVDPAEPITPPRGDAAAGVSRSKRLGLLRMSLTRHLIDTHTRAQKKQGIRTDAPLFLPHAACRQADIFSIITCPNPEQDTCVAPSSWRAKS